MVVDYLVNCLLRSDVLLVLRLYENIPDVFVFDGDLRDLDLSSTLVLESSDGLSTLTNN